MIHASDRANVKNVKEGRNMARGRAANGSGTQPRLRPDGRWEVRYSAGINPGSGKSIRKSIYGKTAMEVVEKLRAVTASIDAGTYIEPQKMQLGAWCDIWLSEYCGAIKPGTLKTYSDNVKNHIKPALGAVKLCELQPHDVQRFINGLGRGKKPLSPKTIKNVHGTLCKALTEAARVHYIASNPANGCILPKVQHYDIMPLNADEIAAFTEAIKGNPSEPVFYVALNTGMRLSELLGLRWSRVDFKKGTIKVDAQMMVRRGEISARELGQPKNNRPRTFAVAPAVMDCLKAVQRQQKEWKLQAGPVWRNDLDLVFTDEVGKLIPHNTIENRFRKAVRDAGLTGHRFHDLRHTFATEALRAGVDAKSISETLGHSSVAFTLDVYAGFTADMQEEAAQRMQALILSRDRGQ